jgi:predicted dehydrogenase
MQSKRIKIAFLGGGINSAVGRAHVIAIEMDKRFELVAGCFSREESINKKSADEYKVEENRVYQNLDSLIDNEKGKIDAICILTPTPNHVGEILKCIENKISIICEKALTGSSSDAIKIQKAVKKNNTFLTVTYNYTGYPMLRELKEMIKSGMHGKINQIHLEMPQEGFYRLNNLGKPLKVQEWRLSDLNLPTISLDLGVHVHNIIYFLTGESPIGLVALQKNFNSKLGVVDDVSSIVDYTNNMVANIWFSKVALGHRNGLKVQVYGESLSSEWLQNNPEILQCSDNKGRKFTIDRGNSDVKVAALSRYNRFKAGHPSGFIEAFANYYSDIADALLENSLENEFIFDIDHAIEGLIMLEAIAESSQSKKWIKI